MLHPRLTPVGSSTPSWLTDVIKDAGVTSRWGDLTYQTRWGQGASGMFEASWTLALPAGYDSDILRRGTLVELMEGEYRVGCPLVLSEPAVGAGLADPWQFTATGLGRDVEGENSFYAFKIATGATTAVPSEGALFAQAGGWRVTGLRSSVPTSAIGGTSTTDELNSVGALLNAAGDSLGQSWGVDSEGYVFFAANPTTPTYQVTPGAAALGTTDESYASVVWGRYLDSTTGTYLTVYAVDAPTTARFGRKEYPANLIPMGAMSAASAQAFVDGIMARVKGRLGWTNGLTLTSNDLQTMGGVPADLSKVAEDVGTGCMVRLHSISDDLLDYTGNAFLDIVIGEARLTDGGQTIDLSPAGLAPRDFAAIIEEVTGYKEAA